MQIRSLAAGLLFLFAVPLISAKPEKVENFSLIDHEGKFHELDYYLRIPGVKGLVIFIQGNGCPLVQKRVPELNRMKEQFQSKGILFCMLNANSQDERNEIRTEAEEFEIDMPILVDDSQLVARLLGVERTAEAILIQSSGKKVVYRGAIDDRLDYQKEKPAAEKHFLRDALEALIDAREITTPVTDAPGCKITFPKVREISYSEEIAPILIKNCVECHRSGGLGPFSMSSHKKVRGWSEMISEVILTKQMPPWHADPAVGTFQNDCGLSPEEANLIVSWILADAPRGDGPDPLTKVEPAKNDWKLGEPGNTINLPRQEVPAEGVLDYRYVTIDSPFDKDVWLTASEIRPGNTRVLHHVIVTAHPPGKRRQERWITGYAPGTQGQLYPDNSSVHLPKGWKLRFQLHYTVSGKEEVDETRLGLHVTDKPTENIFKTAVIAHSKFRIPPRAAEYQSKKTIKLRKDSTVYAINPHMHFRGKYMNFTAKPPGKNSKPLPLLSVPNYNFNWQRTYLFEEPIKLPAGTEIEIRNAWDNSALNPHNPDPSKTVKWGEQSFDEMFFATIGYIED